MGHKAKPVSIDATATLDQASSSQLGNDGNAAASSAFTHLSFEEVLEDLSSRFIVNLPAEELASIERICFQVEQAHWFYEDFLRQLNPSLASFSLRRFSSHLLYTSSLTVPLIQRYISTSSKKKNQQDLEAAFDEFMKYKTRVPVCGVVMLNKTWDKCVLVKGWKSSAAWGFPKGKINQQESERDCAVREVLEETGFDCDSLLKPDSSDFMELTMREQKIRLYIVPGVDEETHFETLTRKEISRIAWFKLSDLPTWKKNRAPPQGMGGKFYLISPFIGKLKLWIQQNRPQKFADVDSIPTEPASMRLVDNKEESVDVRSDDLKLLLGLGGGPSSNELMITGKGSKMIEEQGDARGRQLLDLLRGPPPPASGPQEQRDFSSPSPPSTLMDERERGTAALLAALNAGAGKVSQIPSTNETNNSAALLSMLNGGGARGGGPSVGSLGDTREPSYARTSSPLPAPQAQNSSQSQDLLNLISPAVDFGSTSQVTDSNEKDRERARQRDALLSSLMASSSLGSVQEDRRGLDYRFPPVPPPPTTTTQRQDNLLSLLQPNGSSQQNHHHQVLQQQEQQQAPPRFSPSPFSTFVQQANRVETMPQTSQDMNPILALLNNQNSKPTNTGPFSPSPALLHSPIHPASVHYQSHQQLPPAPPPPQFTAYPPPPPPHFYTGYQQQGPPSYGNHPSYGPLPPHLQQLYQHLPPPPPPPASYGYHAPLQNNQAMDALAHLLPS